MVDVEITYDFLFFILCLFFLIILYSSIVEVLGFYSVVYVSGQLPVSSINAYLCMYFLKISL